MAFYGDRYGLHSSDDDDWEAYDSDGLGNKTYETRRHSRSKLPSYLPTSRYARSTHGTYTSPHVSQENYSRRIGGLYNDYGRPRQTRHFIHNGKPYYTQSHRETPYYTQALVDGLLGNSKSRAFGRYGGDAFVGKSYTSSSEDYDYDETPAYGSRYPNYGTQYGSRSRGRSASQEQSLHRPKTFRTTDGYGSSYERRGRTRDTDDSLMLHRPRQGEQRALTAYYRDPAHRDVSRQGYRVDGYDYDDYDAAYERARSRDGKSRGRDSYRQRALNIIRYATESESPERYQPRYESGRTYSRPGSVSRGRYDDDIETRDYDVEYVTEQGWSSRPQYSIESGRTFRVPGSRKYRPRLR